MKTKATKGMKPAELPDLSVRWFYDRATLETGEGERIAVLKDSVKAQQFEEIARRANAYPKLVEALRHIGSANRANAATAERMREIAEAALRELGEIT